MKSGGPLVSIGMPVRNGGALVERALTSLLAQTHAPVEVIVFDNASTDGTYDICRRIAGSDERVRLHRNAVDIGQVENFQATLREAHGEFFMWAAHDDEWDPRFVEVLLQRLARDARSAAAMSAVQHRRPTGEFGTLVRWSAEASPEHLGALRLASALAAGESYFQYIYGLFRTDYLRAAARGMLNVACSDVLFTMNCALGTRFTYVDEPLIIRNDTIEPWHEKYPDDVLAKRMSTAMAYPRTVVAAGPYLLRSGVIPLHRKLLVPFLVARLTVRLLRITFGELRLRRRRRAD